MMSRRVAGDGSDAPSSDADAVTETSNAKRDERDDFEFKYEFIEEVERLERYKSGGYHPVALGDTLHHG